MYKIVLPLLLLFIWCDSSAQIVTGSKQKHDMLDSSSIALSNLMADPEDGDLPHTIIASRLGIWAPTFKFEERINKSFSAGFNLGGRFIFFTGGKIEPFGRYYFKANAPKGLFIQIKGVVGIYHTKIRDGSFAQSIVGANPRGGRGGGRGNAQLPSTLLQTYGGGITVGYQWLLGKKKHCALEAFAGVQYVYSTLDISNKLIIQKLALQNPLELGIKIGGAF